MSVGIELIDELPQKLGLTAYQNLINLDLQHEI